MALRLLYSGGNAASQAVAKAVESTLKGAGVNVTTLEIKTEKKAREWATSIQELPLSQAAKSQLATEKDFNAISVAGALSGAVLAAPLTIEHQRWLASQYRLHSKVLRTAGELPTGTDLTFVSSIINSWEVEGDLLKALDVYSNAGFVRANQRATQIRALVAGYLKQTATLAVKEAAGRTADTVPLTVVTKNEGKLSTGLSSALEAEVEEVLGSGIAGAQKAAPNSRSTAQVYNGLVMFPEKFGVLVAAPESWTTQVGKFVAGAGGGNGMVSARLVGEDLTVYTSQQTSNPSGVLLSAAAALEADNKKAEAKKVRDIVINSKGKAQVAAQ